MYFAHLLGVSLLGFEFIYWLNLKDLKSDAYTSTSENLCRQRDGIILCGELVSDKIIHLKKKKKRQEEQEKKADETHNPNLDSGALMLTCGCSHILIAESTFRLHSLHVFHSHWIIGSNFLNTPSYTVEWLAVSLIAFSGATPMSCGRRPAKYYS